MYTEEKGGRRDVKKKKEKKDDLSLKKIGSSGGPIETKSPLGERGRGGDPGEKRL